MADLITSHQSSDKLAKFTEFNLLNKNSLFGIEQISEKSSPLSHKESSLCNDEVGNDSSIFKISIPKQKKVISASSSSRLSTPQNHKPNVNLTDLAKVKISALLYEITERTNQLAQPRPRVTETKISQKSLKYGISKPTSRILELACPKVVHDLSKKPINFVSSSALKAIATQRIIELSQPRKDRHFKLLTRKTRIPRSCNSRIRDLPTSKEVNYSAKVKRFTLSGKDKSEMAKLHQRFLRSTSDNDRNARSIRKKLERETKAEISKKTRKQESLYSLNNTNSDRSIVIINLS
ncbi:uncharacterized protein [Anoplolepis gracilipes]|uniref:uncharacterized protein n=1 Tax=Anoplolepis gracilipes TaxID=354296 RepID=UPI003BA29576